MVLFLLQNLPLEEGIPSNPGTCWMALAKDMDLQFSSFLTRQVASASCFHPNFRSRGRRSNIYSTVQKTGSQNRAPKKQGLRKKAMNL
jgi:hypothetical protein